MLTYVSLKNSYVPSRIPEYVNSRIIDAVNPCVTALRPSLRTIWVPTAQNAFADCPGTDMTVSRGTPLKKVRRTLRSQLLADLKRRRVKSCSIEADTRKHVLARYLDTTNTSLEYSTRVVRNSDVHVLGIADP